MSYACMCARDVYVCMYVHVHAYMYVCVYVLVRVATWHIAHSRHILPGVKRPASSGPAARSSSELDAWLATLHAQAALASDEAVQVNYFGRQYGRADRALFRAGPQDWKLQPGEPRCRAVVCFSWQPRIPQAVPASMTQQRNDKARTLGAQAVPASITCQRNDDARARALTRPGALAALAGSVPCVSWAACAFEIVEQAAKTVVEVHSQALREEFGQQLECVHALVFTVVLNCRFLNSTFFHA